MFAVACVVSRSGSQIVAVIGDLGSPSWAASWSSGHEASGFSGSVTLCLTVT